MSECSRIKQVFDAAKEGKALSICALLYHQEEDAIKECLTNRTSEDGQSCSPLLIAARNGHTDVVKLLLTGPKFNIDIEETGTVKFDGYTIKGATALWSAAGAGHLEVVKLLLLHGANVNNSTSSNSTPLRAACFNGGLDIVKYLIDHGADLTISNNYNNTCLMIASFKGYVNIVKYLLENGADPNSQAHCGATALHFAAERGHLKVVSILYIKGAMLLRNDHNMTAIHMACESSQEKVVKFFIDCEMCSKEEQIEALELLGASFANDRDHYDITKAYEYLLEATSRRLGASGEERTVCLVKNVLSPVEAYGNIAEFQTIKELAGLKSNEDALHVQALIVRERILGEDNPEVPHHIIYRGAVLADAGRFDKCITLWMRALTLRQKNRRTVHKDILRLAQVFAQMLHMKVELSYETAAEVFKYALIELERDQENLYLKTGEEWATQLKMYEANIYSALYLLVITLKVLKGKDDFELCQMVYQFVRMNLKLCENGYSLLHMCVDQDTHVDNFHVDDVVRFPNHPATAILLKCGAEVDIQDAEGNTPLHKIMQFDKPITEFNTLHNIMLDLLQSGAHVDRANKRRERPCDLATTGVSEIILRTKQQISLKCLAAIVIKEHQIPFSGMVPVSLEDFIDMH